VTDAATPRRLWLARHGETTGQSSIRFHGRNDVPLSDHGRAQIRALLPLLAGTPFQRVVHSPLVRATESAQILAQGLGLPATALVAEQRLREISFGDCEGMTEEEIAAAFPAFWGEYRAQRETTFPGGEPRAEFAARVRAATLELAAPGWHGDLLVVSHRGTVRQALRTLLEVPAGTADPYGVELGSLSTVRSEPGQRGWQLEALGLLP
jgi:broad specificity phosphatase PhoE